MKFKLRKSLRDLRPYQNGRHTREIIENHKKILKLDSNEATISPSPHVIGELIQFIHDGPLNLYPDVASEKLCEKIAAYTDLPVDCILTFNGSDHALETIVRACLEDGDYCLMFQPTYDHFRVFAQSVGAEVLCVAEPKEDHLKAAIATGRSLNVVYLVNPNNPTGKLFSPALIAEVVKDFPHMLFVVDEAYFEFCQATVSPLVLTFPNLIVTRSFSKAFGLAGLRCGYSLSHPLLRNELNKIRVGKNINSLAQVAACAALGDVDYMKRYVEDVIMAKQWLVSEMRRLDMAVNDTPANFILIKVENPERVVKFLEAQNIYLRDRSQIESLNGMLRLTVGDPLTMKRFWRIFQKIPMSWLKKAA